jgi:hypothetical protein
VRYIALVLALAACGTSRPASASAGGSPAAADVSCTYNATMPTPDNGMNGGPGTVTISSSTPLRKATYELWRSNDMTNPLESPDSPIVTVNVLMNGARSRTVAAPGILVADAALGPSSPKFVYMGTDGVECGFISWK